MVSTIKIKSGDRKPYLSLVLSGGPADWTGATAEIAVKAQGRPGPATRYPVTLDVVAKTVDWDYVGFDTSVAGTYLYEVIVTFADGHEMTAPNEGFEKLIICKSL